jgi:hypothetical protein
MKELVGFIYLVSEMGQEDKIAGGINREMQNILNHAWF